MSDDKLFYLFSDPWKLQVSKEKRKNNKYVCLSGNSGVGKSTLLRSIGEAIYKHDNKTLAVDEKNIHHPFLSSLFCDTHKYGFQIQLNFIIQRSLLINKCVDNGYNLIMERSLFDDRIFMMNLLREGMITQDEYSTYLELWDHLLKRTRIPDIMILLDFPLDFAIGNVTADECSGRRPKEFPSEEKKEKWLSSWHELYAEFFNEMRNNNYNIHIIDHNKNTKQDETLQKVHDYLSI